MRAIRRYRLRNTHSVSDRTKPKSRRRQHNDLTTCYHQFLETARGESNAPIPAVDRERRRTLARLARRGITTVGDLLHQLPALPTALRLSAIELIWLLKLRRAAPVLIGMMSVPEMRVACANALYLMDAGKRFARILVWHGRRELQSPQPDVTWLDAAIVGLGCPDDREAIDLLVTIFASDFLPGWLRGDAADKLGCVPRVHDRRTAFFRRCRDTALRGLVDQSIDVRFWSIYLIGSLASHRDAGRKTADDDFRIALPVLRKIAATDHRLAPGYWWPVSAEAEDVIGCIETGRWPEPDAADRWAGNTERGAWRQS